MIFFLVTQKNRFPIDKYLFSRWGWSKIKKIQPISYERLFQKKEFCAGVYIFSDIELLNAQERITCEGIYSQLQSLNDQVILINHPTRSKRRYQLLKTLFEQGINSFRVYRMNEDISGLHYPVFLRMENEHSGAKSELIHDEQELKAEIENLREKGKLLDQYIICEFCDTSDEKGIFRKYSAFVIDGKIIPRHIFFSRHWEQKNDDLYSEEFFKEELDYLQTNPHEETLQSIFKDACIDYGRIDYSFLNGKIQVWEINTNPRILTSSTPTNTIRSSIHQIFSRDISLVWNSLYSKNGARTINYPWEKPRLYWELTQSRPNNVRAFKRKVAKKFPWILRAYLRWKYP